VVFLSDNLAVIPEQPCWALENLAAGAPVNVIEVDPETSRWALEALKRMLEVR
jgi:quinolinate synthase